MILLWKQLTKELFKNKIHLIIVLMLTFFTSCMFFFVQFSVDENLKTLDSIAVLSKNQRLYQNGIISNTILARNGLTAFSLLTGFVLFIFFNFFFKKEKKQIGCLKSLGFKDSAICSYFVCYTAIFSLIGGLLGLFAGYFVSDLLINANISTYLLSDLKKGLSLPNLILGMLSPILLYCLVTIASYSMLRRKEIALLTAGNNDAPSYTLFLRFANKIAQICPIKDKLSIRLALRKPIADLFILLSVMICSVMFMLAFSLNKSSQIVYDSQTAGHKYLYDTTFENPQIVDTLIPNTLPYLTADAAVTIRNKEIKQTAIGIETQSEDVFWLLDRNANPIDIPEQNEIIISQALQELYSIKIGDTIPIEANHNKIDMVVSNIACNAKTNGFYLSKIQLTKMFSLPSNSYNGIFSMENLFPYANVTSNAQKLDALKRDSTSNRISAVINQVIGCVVGFILLFLALLLNFQDSKRDILILHLMGHHPKNIHSMLIDVFKPFLGVSFILTLYPGIIIVKMVLKSLSLQIGDYLPFSTNSFIILLIFIIINLLYYVVQKAFHFGIQKIVNSGNILDYTN